MIQNNSTNWIWVPVWTPEDNDDARIVYFRKEFDLAERHDKYEIKISADSRYKLYINGHFVQEGPQKATDLKEWFVDTADLSPFLTVGVNTAACEVLRYPAPSSSSMHPKSNDSLYRTEMPGLYVEDLTADADSKQSLSGDAGWKCHINREIIIVGEDELPAPIHAQEDVTASDGFAGWKLADYDDSDWEQAVPRLVTDISMGDAPFNLMPRNIPLMHYEEKSFESVVTIRQADAEEGVAAESYRNKLAQEYDNMLNGSGCVDIPAHSRQIVEITSGAEECGYLLYSFSGGRNSRISTLCSECYVYPQARGGYVKGDRADHVNGQLMGHRSYYKIAGYGTDEAPEEYEPFWFRTFRYIRLEIETADEPLRILGFRYRSTGYPLEVRTKCSASDSSFEGIWDISVRTLRRCMHDTYMDCPFYEQLQYAMDTRSEALYTYALSADDRLARQAMEAFRRSQRPDGMINCDAPTIKCNVIPGFSIYYLLMVHDHMLYFGDRELVRTHMPAIDQILAFFERHLTDNGIVGKIGGPLYKERYWSFADWTPEWDNTSGTPSVTNKGEGSSTIESLQYLYGLQKAAELAEYIGRNGLAEEYRDCAHRLRDAVRKCCTGTYTDVKGDSHALIQDGPGFDDYSVHCQVFAILTGTVSPEEGKAMLEAVLGEPGIAQASVSFSFYLFRAMEMCGCYEKTEALWEPWRRMLSNNLTTCVENNTDERSDCHAWGSLLLYELPSVILGVRPAAPGYEKISVHPVPGYLDQAEGTIHTPHGNIYVEWHTEEGETVTSIECSDELRDRLIS